MVLRLGAEEPDPCRSSDFHVLPGPCPSRPPWTLLFFVGTQLAFASACEAKLGNDLVLSITEIKTFTSGALVVVGWGAVNWIRFNLSLEVVLVVTALVLGLFRAWCWH